MKPLYVAALAISFHMPADPSALQDTSRPFLQLLQWLGLDHRPQASSSQSPPASVPYYVAPPDDVPSYPGWGAKDDTGTD